MNSIEFAEKQLRNAETLKDFYWNEFATSGDRQYFELAKKQAKKVEKKKEQLDRAQSAQKTRVIKELQIAFLAAHHELEDKKMFNRTEADKATAIIDEIIESELNSHAKLTLIKLFVNNKISCIEIDAILSNE